MTEARKTLVTLVTTGSDRRHSTVSAAKAPPNPRSLVAFPQAAMARVAVEYLEAADIAAVVEGGSSAGVYGGIHEGLAAVVVDVADVERARAVLGLDPPSSSAAPASSPVPRNGGVAAFAAVVFAATSVGLGWQLAVTRAQLDDAIALGSYGPARRDGPCTVYPLLSTGKDAWSSCDLDGDGVYETSRQHDDAGRVMQESKETPEETSTTSYDTRGKAMSRSVAHGRGGLWDVTIFLDTSGVEAGRGYDDDRDSRLDRWVRPGLNGASSTWIDRYGWGLPSEMEWRDAEGNVTQRLRETRDGWQPFSPDTP